MVANTIALPRTLQYPCSLAPMQPAFGLRGKQRIKALLQFRGLFPGALQTLFKCRDIAAALARCFLELPPLAVALRQKLAQLFHERFNAALVLAQALIETLTGRGINLLDLQRASLQVGDMALPLAQTFVEPLPLEGTDLLDLQHAAFQFKNTALTLIQFSEESVALLVLILLMETHFIGKIGDGFRRLRGDGLEPRHLRFENRDPRSDVRSQSGIDLRAKFVSQEFENCIGAQQVRRPAETFPESG